MGIPCFDFLVESTSSITFDRAAYKYHASALFKTLLTSMTISKFARQNKGALQQRVYTFSTGQQATLTEPRDYDNGRFEIVSGTSLITDRLPDGQAGVVIEPILEGNHCVGIIQGEETVMLKSEESALLGEWTETTTLTAKMHDLKRVGLYRLFADVHAGRGAYPLDQGVEDMVIEHYLDSLGFYTTNPLLHYKSPLGSKVMKVLVIARKISGRLTKTA